jgi:hypothetical protein
MILNFRWITIKKTKMKIVCFPKMTGLILIGLLMVFNSCEDGMPVVDADYFDEVIYMPAALHNPYMIDDVPRRRGDSPTPGSPIRYRVYNDDNRFDVLLAAYRAGVYSKGSFPVDITVHTDTIQALIDDGAFPGMEILPTDRFTIPQSAIMNDGEDLAKFELAVDLEFLRDSYPDAIYGIAVSISSTERQTNPDLATTLIIINTRFIKPTAGFTHRVTDNEVVFTNISRYGMEYSWNFGDGSAVSDEVSPSHTYAASGTYDVSLTALGVTGSLDEDVFTVSVTIP